MAVTSLDPEIFLELRAGLEERVDTEIFPAPERFGGHADNDARGLRAVVIARDYCFRFPQSFEPPKRRLLDCQ